MATLNDQMLPSEPSSRPAPVPEGNATTGLSSNIDSRLGDVCWNAGKGPKWNSWMVGGKKNSTPLKNIKVTGMDYPFFWIENLKKCSKAPTSSGAQANGPGLLGDLGRAIKLGPWVDV